MNAQYRPYIFIDTKFVRQNETILSLACMERSRRIPLPHEITDMPRKEQVEYLKEIVLRHGAHVRTLKDAKLPLWGVPVVYVCYIEHNLTIEMSPDGRVIRQITEPMTHDGAVLKVGNKVIAGVGK